MSASTEDALLACVHCGLCLPACPTFKVLGDENDSPRGRVYLMRAAAEGRVTRGDAFQLHIGRCLGCRACETACPAGVEYGRLLEHARAEIRSEARTRGLAGLMSRFRAIGTRVALWALTGTPGRVTFPLLRLLRRLGIAGIARRLPGRLGTAAGLLDATRPRWGPRAPSARGRRDARTSRGAPSVGSGPTVALFGGCVMDGLFSHVHLAARATLAASGYRPVPLPRARCCGALHHHAGFPETARRMARRNVRAVEASGAEWLAVDSAGCGAALRDYDRWLEDDAGWADRARAVSAKVRDVTELLSEAPTPVEGRLEGRIAYDAPCHLLHAQGVRDEPLRILSRIAGAEVTPLPSASHCCGGAGVYNLFHPELAEEILRPKLEEIRLGEYDWVATGNPGCIMQLGAGLQRAGFHARVVHPVELLHAACTAGP